MNISVKLVETDRDLNQAYAIRRKVFVIEQKVPVEIEMDEYESIATHVIAYANDIPVGTARWRLTEEGAKLERFAVLKLYRSKGVGQALVKFIMNQVKDSLIIYLNAQESVIAFYEQFGFRPTGEIFFEANIPHIKMMYEPDTDS